MHTIRFRLLATLQQLVPFSICFSTQTVGKSAAQEHGDDQIAAADIKYIAVTEMGSHILHPTGLMNMAKAMSPTPHQLRTHAQMQTVFFFTRMNAIELRKRGRAIARGGVSLTNNVLATMFVAKSLFRFGVMLCATSLVTKV